MPWRPEAQANLFQAANAILRLHLHHLHVHHRQMMRLHKENIALDLRGSADML